MIIQNASGTFDPWQHTGIQSVLFNISKLPKKAEGRWWAVRDLSVSDHTQRRFGYHECCSKKRILASEKRLKERMAF